MVGLTSAALLYTVAMLTVVAAGMSGPDRWRRRY